MNCRTCGAKLKPQAHFCASCGAEVGGAAACEACGAEVAEGAVFCSHCGSRVGEALEHGVEAGRAKAGRIKSHPKTGSTSRQGFASGLPKRLLFLLVGLLLLALGVSQMLLLVSGQTSSGVVTEVGSRQRQSTGVQVGDRKSYEYVYPVKYRFMASDGSIQTGSYDFPEGPKPPPRAGSNLQIKYLSFYPSINRVNDDLSVSFYGLLLLAIGAALAVGSLRR